MTDKELLEYAAKAAGIGLQNIGGGKVKAIRLFGDYAEHYDWNPLTDDGDALRLAVKLKMLVQVYYSDSFRYVTSAKCWSREIENCVFASEDIDPDPCAATRRAIVRAAAKIGKAMP